jgi:hypothetical protein
MTLTLEIAPEVEARLRDKAKRRGMAVDAYLLDLAARDEPIERDETDLDAAMRAGAEIMAPLYAESLATGGELTAATTAPGDFHEYSAEELAAMEAGKFEQPLRRAA